MRLQQNTDGGALRVECIRRTYKHIHSRINLTGKRISTLPREARDSAECVHNGKLETLAEQQASAGTEVRAVSSKSMCNARPYNVFGVRILTDCTSFQVISLLSKHKAKLTHADYEIYLSACSASNRAEDLASWNNSCTELTSAMVMPSLPEVLAKTCAGVSSCVACRNEAVSPIKPKCAKLSSSISISSTCREVVNPVKRCCSSFSAA